MNPLIITHGGVGSPTENKGGTDRAAEAGIEILKKGGSALDAVEAAIVVMEDDIRFNAGIGSFMRWDGTIEMDALLMDSEGNCGAVAAIREVKNPITVARKVMSTPHILLAGEGAIEFARKFGFEKFDPTTEKAIKKLAEMKEKLENDTLPEWYDKWRDFKLSDTVGGVARDRKGRFAAGNSSGGIGIALRGRVGDSPIIGSGAFAGEQGAVTATGVGEEIMRVVLSKSVYDRIAQGMNPQEACEWGIALFEPKIPIGVIAVSRKGSGAAANKEMACSFLEGD
jgi:isoaspartyl peptidase/L-asparaginase-like protein (Ntn-hydrolase superfamily)